ncbi:MAG: site-specific integrase [Opitutaceae bacterium]|nr:site-specific integrase [Opitutaceae bacterium]
MICHVYRRGRLYWGKLQLEHELTLSRLPLATTDRRVAQSKLWEIAKEREKENAGLLPPHSAREAAVAPLSGLLQAFLDDLQVKGRSANTTAKYRNTLGKLFARCHWRLLRDITARSFCEWRVRSGLSPKTLNDLLGALMTFLSWLVHQRLAVENPLQHVERIDTRGKRGQFRRCFSAAELSRLLEVSPPHRRIVYFVAAYTGLRRSEMTALRWSDLLLDEAAPILRVRASMAKNRKDAVLPLHSDLVAALRAFRPPDAAPFAPVLAGLVPRIPTFRKDLSRAGIAFLDEQGRRADLHALRVTYGTNLTLGGAAPRVVMELMRHSDIKLTMRIYTDAGQLPLAEAVAKLPALPAKTLCPKTCPNSCPNGGLEQSEAAAS